MPGLLFDRIAIVGCGLLGGSLGLALRRAGVAREVLGVDRDDAVLQQAERLGAITRGVTLTQAAHADLLVLAAPVLANLAILRQLAPMLGETTLLSDVGSTKASIIHAAEQYLGDAVARFIPAHPIAGRETHGIASASADLFVQRQVMLTPLSINREEDVARLQALWQACGAQVMRLAASDHDRLYARVSHLPHLLAFALMSGLGLDEATACRLAGPGFRDFTRIAASDPGVWAEILHDNRKALRLALGDFEHALHELRSALEQPHQLAERLEHASRLRRGMSQSNAGDATPAQAQQASHADTAP